MLLIFIVGYLVLTVLTGVWASRRVKSSGDFMLAGRSLPIMLSSAALFATWFGSETVFGASSEFLEGGLAAVVEDPFGAALCLLLFGLVYAKRLYKMNLLTLGDFFRVRFGRKTELIASLFLALPYSGYIAAQLVAMGIILNVVTGMEIWHGVLISSVVVTAYTFVGGMWAISITDFVQSILIIIGLLVMSVILSIKAGGVATVLNEAPPGTFHFLPPPDMKSILAFIAAWCVLGLGSIPSQDVFQRSMSSKSAKVAEYSCYIGAFLYLLFAMLPLYISLCTKHLYPDQYTADTQVALPTMVLQNTHIVVQVLFFGSLLSAIMSTTSSSMLAPASIFSENLIRPLFGHRISDKRFLGITKACVLFFSVIASVMACMRSNIYELVGESSILSLVSLFIPLTLGMFWRKAKAEGAIASMFVGILAWLVFENVDTGIPSLIPATLLSLFAMVAGTYLAPNRTAEAHS